MEGSPGPSDLQEQLKEREAEVGVLRNRLSQAQEEIDRLRRENEQLRQELRASGRGRARGQSKRKAKRKRSGRKAGKGRFTFRGAPASAVTKGPSQPVPGMPVLRWRIAVGTNRRGDGHRYAGATPTRNQMLRGGSAPV